MLYSTTSISALLPIVVLQHSVWACQPALQPNYCVTYTLADYTYQAKYFSDNITLSSESSEPQSINRGFMKAVQYDVLRYLQFKGLCDRVYTSGVLCFRPGPLSPMFPTLPAIVIHLRVGTSLSSNDLNNLLGQLYGLPLPSDAYKLYEPPKVTPYIPEEKCGCN